MKRHGLLLSLFASLTLQAAEPESYLLRGATVHTVGNGDIANGSVLIVNGKIAGVGEKLSAPRGATVIEAKGLHVYPGMVDSATQIGLSEIGSVRETNDLNEIGEFNPQLRALIAVNPESEHIPVTRVNGITSVITMPAGIGGTGGAGSPLAEGIIQGQAALIHLDGWTWEEMEVKRSAAMMMRFPTMRTSTYSMAQGPGRRPFTEAQREYDQAIQRRHEFFEQARRYQRAKAAGGKNFETDLKLEAMLPVLEGKMPLMVIAPRERTIRDAVKFAQDEKIRIVLAAVREPGAMLPELKAKNIPVILGQVLELPLEEDDAYDAPFTLPLQLHQAGVKFAFGTFTTQFSRNLPYEAAAAVAFGLPKEAAMRALTLTPAEIWGVEQQIGSIAEGKLADLIVADGDLLEARTQVKHLFIKGKPVDLSSKHTRLYDKYKNRP